MQTRVYHMATINYRRTYFAGLLLVTVAVQGLVGNNEVVDFKNLIKTNEVFEDDHDTEDHNDSANEVVNNNFVIEADNELCDKLANRLQKTTDLHLNISLLPGTWVSSQ